MRDIILKLVNYLVLVACAAFFAYRAWGYYPAWFVVTCGCLAIAFLNMIRRPS